MQHLAEHNLKKKKNCPFWLFCCCERKTAIMAKDCESVLSTTAFHQQRLTDKTQSDHFQSDVRLEAFQTRLPVRKHLFDQHVTERTKFEDLLQKTKSVQN